MNHRIFPRIPSNLVFAAAVALGLGADPSSASPPCEWLRGKVSGDRVGIYFFAEGFTENQRPLYDQMVDEIIQADFGDGKVSQGSEPLGSYRDAFRIYRLWTPSVDSGILPQGRSHDTWFGGYLDAAGAPTIPEQNVWSLVDFVDTGSRCPSDPSTDKFYRNAVILVNYQMASGQSVYEYRYLVMGLGQRALLFLHEFGHLFGALGEEYSSNPYPEPADPYFHYPNNTQTTVRDSIPWARWIDPSTPVPTIWTGGTVDDVVGLYEGANRATTGWYRPAKMCAMNLLGDHYCPVCREQMAFWAESGPSGLAMDTMGPAPGTEVRSGWIVARQIRSSLHPNRARWSLDGQDLGIVGDSIEVDRLPRSGTLRAAFVGDTIYVRDPELIYQDTLSWTVLKSTGTNLRAGINGGIRRLAPGLFQVPTELLPRVRLFDASGSRIATRIVAVIPEGVLVGSDGAGGRKLFLDVLPR